MMVVRAPDLIIFDCDGVLVDSERLSFEALQDMVVSQHIEISTDDLKKLSLGRSVKATIEAISDLTGKRIDGATIDVMNAGLFQHLAREVTAMAGVRPALARISTPKCVASSSALERIHISLGAAGLLDEFAPNIFSADMVQVGKPAPDLFLLAASMMGADPRRCIVIEDSPAGIEAAHRAGMLAFAFCGGSHVDDDLAAAIRARKPELVFGDMVELPGLLADQLSQAKIDV